jgi:peptidoglycan/xylan/chitin deacetylase (PgdA/CDA1 family)
MLLDYLVSLLLLLSVAAGLAGPSDAVAAPPPPRVLALTAAYPDAARLSWEDGADGVWYRVCLAADRSHAQPAGCIPAGWGDSALVPVPETDDGRAYLTLAACRPGYVSCSEPVAAGLIGRRLQPPFDFYAVALLGSDGRATLGGYSLHPEGTLSYHRAAPGRADQVAATCPTVGVGGCDGAVVSLPGAWAGVALQVEGAGASGLTLELRERPRAALLFDDGTGLFTGDRLTVQTVLDQYGVPGTFFLIGRVMRDRPAVVRALVAAGHRVGNHTFSHPSLTALPDARVLAELDQTEAQYRAIVPGGTTRPCFRAPNGAVDGRVRRLAAGRGYQQIDWNVTSADWSGVPAARIVRDVLDGVHDGARISFHTQER